jgi:hypothetical protein
MRSGSWAQSAGRWEQAVTTVWQQRRISASAQPHGGLRTCDSHPRARLSGDFGVVAPVATGAGSAGRG